MRQLRQPLQVTQRSDSGGALVAALRPADMRRVPSQGWNRQEGEWVPDSETKCCMRCSAAFTLTRCDCNCPRSDNQLQMQSPPPLPRVRFRRLRHVLVAHRERVPSRWRRFGFSLCQSDHVSFFAQLLAARTPSRPVPRRKSASARRASSSFALACRSRRALLPIRLR